jgi:hypothetical protein
MNRGVLIDRAAEVYAPFDAREAKRLREYVTEAGKLVERDSLTQACKWRVKKVDEVTSTYREELDYAGEEALGDMAGSFRLLYSPKEQMSFDAVRALIYAHVGEGPLHDDALGELKLLRTMKKKALESPWTMTINDKRWSPEDIIDLHLNGRYLHRDEDKADLLDAAPILIRSHFLSIVKRLAWVFAVGREVIVPILAEPSLVPHAQERAIAP